MSGSASRFKMRLPATSANLGSGFDAVAIALNMYLDVEAEAAEAFSIEASGYDSDICGRIEDNLIVRVFEQVLRREGRQVQPLRIRMENGIPLGMGCGSSAAGRLAALSMAVHFGDLSWSAERVLEEACMLEGHPDNAAACWLGGFVAAANEDRKVHVAQVEPPAEWRAIVVQPPESLATSTARAVLPATYSSADAIANIQAVSMLGLAFAQRRGDLLKAAMQDRIHQPYRAEMCPLLPKLLRLAGENGIMGVALSGAGPAVLVVVDQEARVPAATKRILIASGVECALLLRTCRFESAGASTWFKKQ